MYPSRFVDIPRWQWLPASLAIIALAGCGGSSDSDQAGGRSADRVVYIKSTSPRNVPANAPVTSEMYLLNTDGTRRTRVNETSENVFYQSPSLSRDGSKIAVLSSRDNCGGVGCSVSDGYPYPMQVWVMNADGSQSRRVSADNNFNQIFAPVLSPDGSNVFYAVSGEGLWVTNVSTLERKKIYTDSVGAFSISPDGTRIAFSSYSPLTVMNADGTNAKRIATNSYQPSFSPDGSRIVYVERPESAPGVEGPIGPSWLSIINVDGTGHERLNYVSDGVETIYAPVFSQDGKKVIFRTVRSQGGVSQFRLVTMNLDGSNQTSVVVDATEFY